MNDTPDNVIPFPAPESEPEFEMPGIHDRLLKADLDEFGGPLEFAWSMIAYEGLSPFALQLAIGCLCLEINKLKGGELEGSA